MTVYCDRKQRARYLAGDMELDERLEFLFHLDDCEHCWGAVYSATKDNHPHYYKTKGRKLKISERELQKLESPVKQEEALDVAS